MIDYTRLLMDEFLIAICFSYVTKEFNFDNNIKINLDILDSATSK